MTKDAFTDIARLAAWLLVGLGITAAVATAVAHQHFQVVDLVGWALLFGASILAIASGGAPSRRRMLGLTLVAGAALSAVALSFAHLAAVYERGSSGTHGYWELSVRLSMASVVFAILTRPFTEKIRAFAGLTAAVGLAFVIAIEVLNLDGYAWFAVGIAAAFLTFALISGSHAGHAYPRRRFGAASDDVTARAGPIERDAS